MYNVNVLIYLKRVQAVIHAAPKEEVEGKAWILPLGEVRKLGQAESLCWHGGGKAKHKKQVINF